MTQGFSPELLLKMAEAIDKDIIKLAQSVAGLMVDNALSPENEYGQEIKDKRKAMTVLNREAQSYRDKAGRASGRTEEPDPAS